LGTKLISPMSGVISVKVRSLVAGSKVWACRISL